MALSADTHGFWRFFWHSISLKQKSPVLHTSLSHETDYPYRWSRSLILRLPGTTRGLVLGWWRNIVRTEEDAILAGMQGRDMTYKDLLKETMDYDETFQA